MATIISRSQLSHPDLGETGGGPLHTSIAAIYSALGNNANSRYQEYAAIADSTTVELDHNLGASDAEVKVLLYSGSGITKTPIIDYVQLGWVVAEKTGEESTVIEVTTPSSGGPHTFTAIVIDGKRVNSRAFSMLANAIGNAQANTIEEWYDTQKRGLSIDSAGGIQPLNFLGTSYTSSNANAVPGINTLVRSDIATVQVTAPATIANYDIFMVTDAGRNASTNNITVGRNGNTINGVAADYVMSEDGGWALFIGDSTNSDWLVVTSAAIGFGTATPSTEGLVTSYAPTVKSSVLTDATAAVTLTETDGYETVVLSGAINQTLNLPAVADSVGRRLKIIKTNAAGTATIDGNAAELVGGSTTQELDGELNSMSLECDGSAWFIVSKADDRYEIFTASAGVNNLTVKPGINKSFYINPTGSDFQPTLPTTGIKLGQSVEISVDMNAGGLAECQIRASDASVITAFGAPNLISVSGNHGYVKLVANQDTPVSNAHWDIVDVSESGLYTPTASSVSSGAITFADCPYSRSRNGLSISFKITPTVTGGKTFDGDLPHFIKTNWSSTLQMHGSGNNGGTASQFKVTSKTGTILATFEMNGNILAAWGAAVGVAN